MTIILIKKLLVYICLFLIPVFWGLSDGYRIVDPTKYSKLWHRTKGIVQGLIGGIIWGYSSFSLAFLFAVYFWIVFDILVNYIRKLPLTYLGKTAFLDRIFPTFQIQLIVKILLLVVATINFFAFN